MKGNQRRSRLKLKWIEVLTEVTRAHGVHEEIIKSENKEKV